ncbi:hypothetical protein B0H21DRAFT_221496 [Amylocystis lapponica]|nr:hypothetical protein B0H21DRAFT_221496 [Amylocystis lapponica]
MSASIRSPWICDYFINIAETHGGNLASAPPEPKAKAAQIVKFLTFPRSDNADACIWALLSDKTHLVPARLNSEAMKLYRENPLFSGKSVTDHKSALVSVKQFCPLFRRVPLDGIGMSSTERLVLDIGAFDLRGAFGEDLWGSPKDLENHPNIREWVMGLREHGGGGNVLKLRKQEQKKAEAGPRDVTKRPVAAQQILHPPSPQKVRLAGARKKMPQGPPPNPVPTAPARQANPTSKWRAFPSKARAYALPPADILDTFRKIASSEDKSESTKKTSKPSTTLTLRDGDGVSPLAGPSTPRKAQYRPRKNPLDMSSSSPGTRSEHDHASPPPLDIDDDALQPATPSHWSPSVRGSPLPSIPHQTVPEAAKDDGIDHHITEQNSPKNTLVKEKGLPRQSSPVPETDLPLPNTFSSYLSPPTPAQRLRPLTVPSSPPLNSRSSPPPSLPIASVPSSSAPPPVPAPGTGSLYPPLQRRVPLPFSTRHSPDTQLADHGRILVPNSDTSGTASQGYSQSLSYASGSQGQTKGQEQEQAQSQNRADSGSQPHNEVQPSPKSSMLPPLAVAVDDANHADGPEKALSPAHVEGPPSPSVQRHDTPSHDTGLIDEDAASQSALPPLPVVLEEHDSGSQSEDDDADDELDELDSDDDGLTSGHARRVPDEPEAEELDSDDERTKSMVDAHMSAAQQSPAAASERSERDDIPRPASPRVHTPPKEPAKTRERTSRAKARRVLRSSERDDSSDGPVRPSSPDVFINEASFRASQEQDGMRVKKRARLQSGSSSGSKLEQPQLLLRGSSHSVLDSVAASTERKDAQLTAAYAHHDPRAWAAPTFMNKNCNDKGKGRVVEPARLVPRDASIQPTAGHNKRRISISSSPAQPPLKKQKMSAASSGSSGASSSKPSDRHDGRAPTAVSDAPKKQTAADGRARSPPAEPPRRIDLHRSASTTSSAPSIKGRRAGSSTTSASSKPEIRMVKTTVAGTSAPAEIPLVTFPTRSSSSHGKGKERQKTAAKDTPPARLEPPSRSERSGSRLRAIPEVAGRAGVEAAVRPASSGSGKSTLAGHAQHRARRRCDGHAHRRSNGKDATRTGRLAKRALLAGCKQATVHCLSVFWFQWLALPRAVNWSGW